MRRFTVTTKAHNSRAHLPEPVRAEAAVWLARLHSDHRSADVERGFRAWFAADPLHAAAFERMTQSWEATRALRSEQISRPSADAASRGRGTRRAAFIALAASIAALSVAGGWFLGSSREAVHAPVIETALGERRSLVLADGSKVVLNTDSRIEVAFDSKARRIRLERGQARFDVAKAAGRPFIVSAGGKSIVALGTAFDVRWTDAKLSVVLFEGRVSVSSGGGVPLLNPKVAVTLEPGNRAQFERSAVTVRPVGRLEREEAWVGGRAVFEGTPLSEAIAEMNRYTHRRLQLTDPAIGQWRISGTFSVEDVDAFARSLSDLLPLHAEFFNDRILLTPTKD
jgi:transmembrane sensor